MAKGKVPARDMIRNSDLLLNISGVETTGGSHSAPSAQWQLALIWGIHQELKALNRVFACGNAQDIPNILRRIDKNTKKRPKRKLKVKT